MLGCFVVFKAQAELGGGDGQVSGGCFSARGESIQMSLASRSLYIYPVHVSERGAIVCAVDAECSSRTVDNQRWRCFFVSAVSATLPPPPPPSTVSASVAPRLSSAPFFVPVLLHLVWCRCEACNHWRFQGLLVHDMAWQCVVSQHVPESLCRSCGHADFCLLSYTPYICTTDYLPSLFSFVAASNSDTFAPRLTADPQFCLAALP